jgi:hypothetical protein
MMVADIPSRRLVALVPLLFALACSDNPPAGAPYGGVKCETQSDCGQGQSCVNKVCVADGIKGGDVTSGDAASDAKGATPTDAGSADGAGSDNDANSLTDGDPIQDTVTPPADTTTGPGIGKACAVCKNDGECGDGFGCITLLNPGTDKFCAKKCDGAADCPAGFFCENTSTDKAVTQKYCVLQTFTCDGCAKTACSADEQCNYKVSPPKCAKLGKQCGECKLDTECGAGFRCVKVGNAAKACVPECSDSKPCPQGSTCAQFAGVVSKVCAFSDSKCCYGASCKNACSTCAADKCFGGECAECVKDADCKGGKCNPQYHTCITDSCAADKPIKLATGACVECANDSHCAGNKAGPKCNLADNKCEPKTATNECSACKDKYPACVEINGTWSCVECKTDDDCKAKSAGTCNGSTFSCSGTIGPGTGPEKGTCKADSDCQNAGTTSFDLKCDVGTGLCYDKGGGCDNVVAFCNAKAGSNCVAGGGGGLPGLPGGGLPGGAGGGSKCSCPDPGSAPGGGATWKKECDLFKLLSPSLAKCDCSKDPASPDCKVTQPLPYDCCTGGGGGGGAGGGADPLSCVLKAQGGGAASPACFGGKCGMDITSCFSGGTNYTCGAGSGGGLPFP